MTDCVVCSKPMDPVLGPELSHPACSQVTFFEEPYGEDPFNASLKRKLIEIILWADKQNPRASQVKIGPSEIGDPCDRRIAYRLAGVPAVNVAFDPWAAIVGTALHSWLERAVTDWVVAKKDNNWTTEQALHIDEFVEGHSDLYNHEEQAVIDWKGAGPDVMKKLRLNGPSIGYQIQTHIYGYGFERHGWPVKKVVLAFLPRAGWLRDMYIWSAPYDRGIAEAALARVYQIAQRTVALDVLTQSHRWNQIEAVPSNACGFCPYLNTLRTKEEGASDKGCPGQ